MGLTFGIGQCTAMNVKDEFCSALMRRANDFIKFRYYYKWIHLPFQNQSEPRGERERLEKVLCRVIMERLRTLGNDKLRDNQAGLCRERSCSDQIVTLRVIEEQSIWWNSSKLSTAWTERLFGSSWLCVKVLSAWFAISMRTWHAKSHMLARSPLALGFLLESGKDVNHHSCSCRLLTGLQDWETTCSKQEK